MPGGSTLAPVFVEAQFVPTGRPWEEPVIFWRVTLVGQVFHVAGSVSEALTLADDVARQHGRTVQLAALGRSSD
jgi:hypothetical protein